MSPRACAISFTNLQIAKLKGALTDRRIDLAVTDAAKRRLAEAGFDPAFGARPLRRVVQRELQDRLALAILEGSMAPGATVVADADATGIILRPGAVTVE